MPRFVVVVLVLVVLGAGAGWLATQPAGDVQPLQPSSTAVIESEARIFAAFKAAEVKAVLTRTPQPVQVSLNDLELTSLIASRLQQGSGTLHDVVLRGTPDGVFDATTDADWNGWTFHVAAAGTVTFGSDGSIHVQVRDASLGRLPLPGSVVDGIVAQSASAASVNLPPGISNVALQAVAGGGVLTATAAPTVSSVFG
jgi:hypothetical protein